MANLLDQSAATQYSQVSRRTPSCQHVSGLHVSTRVTQRRVERPEHTLTAKLSSSSQQRCAAAKQWPSPAQAGSAEEEVPDALKIPRLREEVITRAKDVLGDTVSPEDLEAIVEKLSATDFEVAADGEAKPVQAALEAAEAELGTLKTQNLRLSADFDNFRKRTDVEKVALRERVRGDVVEQLFPLVDSFEQAKSQLKVESPAEQKIEQAYQGVYKQMLDIFKALGVEPVPGEGQPFDPALHDGIMRTESDDVPDGTVLKEFRRGFVLNGKLLRPAMVQVSFSNTAPPAPSAAAADGGQMIDTEVAAATSNA